MAGRFVGHYIATWSECGAPLLRSVMDTLERARVIRFNDRTMAYEAPDVYESIADMDESRTYYIERRKSGRFSR